MLKQLKRLLALLGYGYCYKHDCEFLEYGWYDEKSECFECWKEREV